MEEQHVDVNELVAKLQQNQFINSGNQYGHGSNSQYNGVQPTYLPGSVQPQPTYLPGSVQPQPTYLPGSVQPQPTYLPGSVQTSSWNWCWQVQSIPWFWISASTRRYIPRFANNCSKLKLKYCKYLHGLYMCRQYSLHKECILNFQLKVFL